MVGEARGVVIVGCGRQGAWSLWGMVGEARGVVIVGCGRRGKGRGHCGVW